MNQNLRSRIAQNSVTAQDKAGFYDAGFWPERVLVKGYSKARVDFISYVVLRFIFSGKPLEILDLGCGTGWLTPFLAQWGKVTAIDFAPKTVAQAQREFGQFAEFRIADASSPSLGLEEYRRFDLVVATEVVEHTVDPAAFLSQLAAFLKIGGWAVVTTPNGRFWNEYKDDPKSATHIQPIENWLMPKQFRQMALEARLQPILREGWIDYSFQYGRPVLRTLTGKSVKRLFDRLRLTRQFARLVTPIALFQLYLLRRDED
jgi:2-polyprenyl-3-methyl-5-hydroxy-6-metoxy-1,4-benzoquinol methylase